MRQVNFPGNFRRVLVSLLICVTICTTILSLAIGVSAVKVDNGANTNTNTNAAQIAPQTPLENQANQQVPQTQSDNSQTAAIIAPESQKPATVDHSANKGNFLDCTKNISAKKVSCYAKARQSQNNCQNATKTNLAVLNSNNCAQTYLAESQKCGDDFDRQKNICNKLPHTWWDKLISFFY